MRLHLYGIVMAFLAASLTQGAWAQTGTILGTVKTSDGGPVVGRPVLLATEWDTVRTVTSSRGTFRFDNVADGRYEVRILLLGSAPWSQAIDIRDGITVSLDATLRSATRRLNRVIVTGMRTGVYGEIGDITSYKPIDDAVVEVIGFRSADTTTNGGRFTLSQVRGGRSYVVRISRPGYEVKTVSVQVPERGGFELNAYLDPGLDRSNKDEHLWREFDNRADWGGTNAALITRADLIGGPRASLASALTLARPLLLKGLRIHPQAISNPGSAIYPCIFVNGRPAPGSVLLDYFELGEIEAIEAYGPGSLQWDRLVGKFAGPRPMHPCGQTTEMSMGFTPTDGYATTMRVPLGVTAESKTMIGVLVIWLRQ
jgi:hypothetical protein